MEIEPTRIELLRSLLARALALKSDAAAGAPFLRAVFGAGIGRLGGSIDDLAAAIERETDQPPANVILLGLYLEFGRRPRGSISSDNQAAVKAVMEAIEAPEQRRIVDWVVRRSDWLRYRTHPLPPSGLRPSLGRLVAATTRESVVGNARELFGLGPRDYEIVEAAQGLIDVAIDAGDARAMSETASALLANADRLKIRAHRLRMISTCSRVIRRTQDAELAATLAHAAVAVLSAPGDVGPRDIVTPSREIADQLASIADRSPVAAFLDALVARASRDPTGLIFAFAAHRFALLLNVARARDLAAAGRAALAQQVSHIDRFEAAVAAASAAAAFLSPTVSANARRSSIFCRR